LSNGEVKHELLTSSLLPKIIQSTFFSRVPRYIHISILRNGEWTRPKIVSASAQGSIQRQKAWVNQHIKVKSPQTLLVPTVAAEFFSRVPRYIHISILRNGEWTRPKIVSVRPYSTGSRKENVD
jgi:hypothetical protein